MGRPRIARRLALTRNRHRPQGRALTASGAAAAPSLHPAVRDSVPRRVLWTSAGLAWCGAIATALLFTLIGVGVDMLGPSIVEISDGSGGAAQPGGFVTSPPALLVVAMVLLAVIGAACAGAGDLLSERAASDTERRLRRLVIGRVYDRGATAASGRTGDLLSLSTTAVEKASNYRASFLGPMIGALTTPLLVLGIMALTVDAVVAGILALLVLLVPILVGGFQRLVRPIGGAYRRTQARLTGQFLEAVQALGTLVHARAAHRAGRRLAARGEEHRRGLMRLLAGNQLLILVVDGAFSLCVIVAAAVLCVMRMNAGELGLGGALAILLMTTLVIGPVDIIGQFFYIGIAGRASQAQISQHLGAGAAGKTGAEAPAGVGPRAGAEAADVYAGDAGDVADAVPGGIVLTGVTAGWPGAAPVLRDVSMRIEPGERVALVGPSGIGKSTLSALIQAHLLPESGTVTVDGLDVARTDPGSIRSRLAVVEQQTFLFVGTIADNLRMAAPDADEERLWKALDAAGMHREVEAMPHGVATEVGERGGLLSGGQRQRLAIARAWLRDAPILVLDEPTSQVDLAGEAAILAALERLAAGRTVLMIAHRPGAILAADRVIDLARLSGSGHRRDGDRR